MEIISSLKGPVTFLSSTRRCVSVDGGGRTVFDSLLLKIAPTPSKVPLFRREMKSALVPFLYS
jgi:hypothetical protein